MSRASKKTTLTFFVINVSHLTFDFTVCLTFFQSFMLPIFFSGLLSYLVGIKRTTGRHAACKRVSSHFLSYVLTSPEAEILCRS